MTTIGLDGFSLQVPDGWGTRLLALVGPQEQFGRGEARFQANVIVAVERMAAPSDPEVWVEDQVQSLKKDLGGFREIKREALEVGGETAQLVDFTFLSPDGIMLRQINCYRPLPGDRFLVMNASHLMGKRFDSARDGFIEIFRSLSVDGAAKESAPSKKPAAPRARPPTKGR